MKIPKRFIRTWPAGCGDSSMPPLFEEWWQMFQEIHPDYEFMTITTYDHLDTPADIKEILQYIVSCAGISDIIRLLALYQYGGIYVDTDVMPIKSFDSLTEYDKPFLAKRSSKSFESAIMGCPPQHPVMKDVLDALPSHWRKHHNRPASVQTGPAFISSILFGRPDVVHLPANTFYPYNGWGAPTRQEKLQIFNNKDNFPPEMIAAHFSNRKWGGNKNRKKYVPPKTHDWWD
jgi:mannosyltransferase OCH1-like enzyme